MIVDRVVDMRVLIIITPGLPGRVYVLRPTLSSSLPTIAFDTPGNRHNQIAFALSSWVQPLLFFEGE